MTARTPINLLLLLCCSGMVSAQPAPDMHVPSYRDNLTPYPLLAGKFGTDPAFSQAELELLARNFEALYGGSKASLTMQKIDQIYSINTNFQVVHYKNAASTGKISTPLKNIEQSHKNDLLYYQAGSLGSALDATTTALTISNLFGTLVASTADPGRTIGYFTNGVFKYVTWLKIDDELMRIELTTNNTAAKVATVTVTRGFSGSTAATHTNKTPVLAPAYFIAPTPGMTAAVSYFNDPAAPLIRQYLADEAEIEYQNKHRGIWIDILGGDFNCITMGGENMKASHKWDSQKRQIYDPLDWEIYSEEDVNFIQTNFFAAHGFHPVIWGNNLGWPIDPNDYEILMLKSTPEKPRPIHGFSQEGEIGSFPAGTTGADYDVWNYSTWTKNLRSTMLMEELKVSAVAVVMDAGSQNANFAQLPAAERHRLLLYGYASYLMAVRVQPNDKIYSKFGFTPLVDPGTNTPFLQLDPIFLYDIGRPTETRTNTDYLGYKLPGQSVFQRHFENGLVLANPGDDTNFVETVTLDQAYFDPETSNNVTQVQMPAKTGKILLRQLDTLPPTVLITAPTNGATFLSNTAIPVSATVTDNVAVAFLELWVNGVLWQTLSNAPYNFSVTNLSLGAQTLAIRGVDSSGNAATSTVSVSIVAQLPYGGLARQIPGLIQAEDYDLGGAGEAYHDTTATNTGGAYRNDDVDIKAIRMPFKLTNHRSSFWPSFTATVLSIFSPLARIPG